MPHSASFARVNRKTFLSAVLTRYLAGQIAESKWQQLMELLDSDELTPSEREIAAAYLLHQS
jgi:hypothetical protein